MSMHEAKVIWKISKCGRKLLFKATNKNKVVKWFEDKVRAERWAFDWK